MAAAMSGLVKHVVEDAIDGYNIGDNGVKLRKSDEVFDKVSNTISLFAAIAGKDPGTQLANVMMQAAAATKAGSEGKLESKDILGLTGAVIGTIGAIGALVGGAPAAAVAAALLGLGLGADFVGKALQETAQWYGNPENLEWLKNEFGDAWSDIKETAADFFDGLSELAGAMDDIISEASVRCL